MFSKIRSFLQGKQIKFPVIEIRKKQLDFREFYIEYPNRHWVWKWEFENDKEKWPEMTCRKLSVLEINWKWWHYKVDLKYRKKHNIYDYCFKCSANIKEEFTNKNIRYCKVCKEKDPYSCQDSKEG